MKYPNLRMRRLRRDILRPLFKETALTTDDLIAPLFVDENIDKEVEISSMPGYCRTPVSKVADDVGNAMEKGIKSFIIFGVPSVKDEMGSSAYDNDGVVQKAIRAIKKEHQDAVVITDVCLCEYTTHGHCGIVEGEKIVNDKTLPLLGKTVVSHAEAGVDMVAPSGMMDGMVETIREHLDSNGHADIPIMSYAAKYASAFYGPFREAAESCYTFGDRRSYQMDIHNVEEAFREVELDIKEGADVVMVKPALAYLDVLRRIKEEFKVPMAAYSVSGEYSMVKAAGKLGWLDDRQIAYELLTSIKRAGADLIITYHALEVAEML